MVPASFDYHRPESLDAAVTLLAHRQSVDGPPERTGQVAWPAGERGQGRLRAGCERRFVVDDEAVDHQHLVHPYARTLARAVVAA